MNIDPIIGVVPPTQSSIPVEGSGTQVDPNPMINVYVARDYIYTPGYVDELQCMIDSTGAIEHVLQDGNYNVVGLLDGSADLLAQYVYDPYGSLVAGDIDVGVQSAVGHQGLFFDRLDANLQAQQLTALPDGQGGFEPPVAGIYHNRNRKYHPGLGRFLQKDPNGTGTALLDGDIWLGGRPTAPTIVDATIIEQYQDSFNIYAYEASTPVNVLDSAGLFIDLLLGGGEALDLYLDYNEEMASTGMDIRAALKAAFAEYGWDQAIAADTVADWSLNEHGFGGFTAASVLVAGIWDKVEGHHMVPQFMQGIEKWHERFPLTQRDHRRFHRILEQEFHRLGLDPPSTRGPRAWAKRLAARSVSLDEVGRARTALMSAAHSFDGLTNNRYRLAERTAASLNSRNAKGALRLLRRRAR